MSGYEIHDWFRERYPDHSVGYVRMSVDDEMGSKVGLNDWKKVDMMMEMTARYLAKPDTKEDMTRATVRLAEKARVTGV